MGKGRFLMELARLHPEINYIGIDRYTSVLLRAVQKMQEDELPNVHFLSIDESLRLVSFNVLMSGCYGFICLYILIYLDIMYSGMI